METAQERVAQSGAHPRPWRVEAGGENEYDFLVYDVAGEMVVGGYDRGELDLLVALVNEHARCVELRSVEGEASVVGADARLRVVPGWWWARRAGFGGPFGVVRVAPVGTTGVLGVLEAGEPEVRAVGEYEWGPWLAASAPARGAGSPLEALVVMLSGALERFDEAQRSAMRDVVGLGAGASLAAAVRSIWCGGAARDGGPVLQVTGGELLPELLERLRAGLAMLRGGARWVVAAPAGLGATLRELRETRPRSASLRMQAVCEVLGLPGEGELDRLVADVSELELLAVDARAAGALGAWTREAPTAPGLYWGWRATQDIVSQRERGGGDVRVVPGGAELVVVFWGDATLLEGRLPNCSVVWSSEESGGARGVGRYTHWAAYRPAVPQVGP